VIAHRQNLHWLYRRARLRCERHLGLLGGESVKQIDLQIVRTRPLPFLPTPALSAVIKLTRTSITGQAATVAAATSDLPPPRPTGLGLRLDNWHQTLSITPAYFLAQRARLLFGRDVMGMLGDSPEGMYGELFACADY
jgi:hypothetical protein